MNAQVRFSDIIRYVLLGVFTLGYLLLLAYLLDIDIILSRSQDMLNFISNSESATFVLVLILIFSLFLGIMIQSLRSIFEYYPMKYLVETNLTQGKPNSKFINKLCSIMLFGSIFHECFGEKKKARFNEDMPHWIYLSENPYTMLNFVRGRMVKDKSSETSTLSESYYYHELFRGMIYCIVLVGIIVLLVFWNDIRIQAFGWLIFILSLVCGIIIMRFAAHIQARTYLRYINSNYDLFIDYKTNRSQYIGNQIPYVYILIRTIEQEHRLHFLTRALESVLNQDYPNKHIILLNDFSNDKDYSRDKEDKIENNLIDRVEKCLQQKYGDKPDFIDNLKKITTYKNSEHHLGASGSSLEIKKSFVNEASENDIAVFLDDDDYFDRNDVLSDIMLKMKGTRADICLTSFRNVSDMGYVLSNGGGKFHNEIIKKLARLKTAITFQMNLIFTDTLGWTKCYSHRVMKKYVETISAYDYYLSRVATEGQNKFVATPSFEDFPDFFCYLFKDIRITAIEKPTHCYFNRNNSLTGVRDNKSFLYRRNFLAYTAGIVRFIDRTHPDNISLCEDAQKATTQFLYYKIGVISNIIMLKFPQYSVEEFLQLLCNDNPNNNDEDSQSYLLRKLVTEKNGEVLLNSIKEFISDKSLEVGIHGDEKDVHHYLQVLEAAILTVV